MGSLRFRPAATALVVALMLASGIAVAPSAVALEPPDALALVEMLRDGKITRLERHLNAYQSAFERGQISDRMVDTAFNAFMTTDPEMVEILTEWVEKRPDSYAARAARGHYYLSLGWIARGGGFANETSDDRFRTMNDFFGLAVEDLEAAISLRPRLSIAYGSLISIAQARGDSARITFLANTALDLAPQSFSVRIARLDSLVPWWNSDRDTEAALADIAEYLAEIEVDSRRYPVLKPLLGYADFVSGRMLYRAELYDDAAKYFERALSFGAYWTYHLARAETFRQNGQYLFAMQSFDAAEGLSPGNFGVIVARGWTYNHIGNYEQAIKVWDRALALAPMDPDVLRAKGRALGKLGRYEEAREAYDKAAFYGAYDPVIRGERGHLLLNQLADEEAALDDLRAATDLDPESPRYWFDYGIALTLTNSCDAAAALATYLKRCEEGGEPGDCSLEHRTSATNLMRQMLSADCQG